MPEAPDSRLLMEAWHTSRGSNRPEELMQRMEAAGQPVSLAQAKQALMHAMDMNFRGEGEGGALEGPWPEHAVNDMIQRHIDEHPERQPVVDEIKRRTLTQPRFQGSAPDKQSSVDPTWQPGSRGKGTIAEDGQVHIWPVNETYEPYHDEYKAANPTLRPATYPSKEGPVDADFVIGPDGAVWEARENPPLPADLAQRIRQVDPRLRPAVTDRPTGFGHAKNLVDILDRRQGSVTPLDKRDSVEPRNVLFHVSPGVNHESIMSEGLRPTRGAQGVNPEGVYGFHDLGDAMNYHIATEPDARFYAINARGLPQHQDPDWIDLHQHGDGEGGGVASYIPSHVTPDRIHALSPADLAAYDVWNPTQPDPWHQSSAPDNGVYGSGVANWVRNRRKNWWERKIVELYESVQRASTPAEKMLAQRTLDDAQRRYQQFNLEGYEDLPGSAVYPEEWNDEREGSVTPPDNRPYDSRVSGVPPEYQRQYSYGACGGLALGLHEATGWPLVKVTDAHSVYDNDGMPFLDYPEEHAAANIGKAGMGAGGIHWLVQHPSGKLVDVDGAHDLADVHGQWDGEGDEDAEGRVALGYSDPEDLRDEYLEAKGEPVPMSVVRQHVPEVLRQVQGSVTSSAGTVGPDDVIAHLRDLHQGFRGRSKGDNDLWWERVERRVRQHPQWERTSLPTSELPDMSMYTPEKDRLADMSAMPGEAPPIVVDPEGLVDGLHRSTLAVQRGDSHIPALRPMPDRVEEADALNEQDWRQSMADTGVPLSSSPRTAMAERSGFPELDAAIAEFMQAHPEVNDFREPHNAHGQCEESAQELAAFLKARGFKAYAPADELHMFPGYQNAQKSEDIGAADFTYPEHAMVEVYGLYGPNNVNTVTIDFTASQYGFTEFPKVHGGPADRQGSVTSSDKGASVDRTYYHGTNVELAPGDFIEPGKAPATWERAHEQYTPDQVYITHSPTSAEGYAFSRAKTHGGDPIIYEVEPHGEPELDPETATTPGWQVDYRVPRARVVRRVGSVTPPDNEHYAAGSWEQSEGSRDSSREFAGGWSGTVYHGARNEEARQAILANGFNAHAPSWSAGRPMGSGSIFFAHTSDGAKYGPRVRAQVTLKKPMTFWWDEHAEPKTEYERSLGRTGRMVSDPPEAADLNWHDGHALAELAMRTGHDGAIFPRRDEMQVFDPSAISNIESYEDAEQRTANILDDVHPGLDPAVWLDPESPEPILKPELRHWLETTIKAALTKHGYDGMDEWLSLVLTGSLTTYQYSEHSDCDVSLWVDAPKFPEWSRAEMIGVMIAEFDDVMLPGTTHPVQAFVVASKKLTKGNLYAPGLRSGYDLQTQRWIEPPDKGRVHDVEHEMNGDYTYALEVADKMESLLRYEPDKAISYWNMIHKRRQRDQGAGKGDFSQANIVYKMLANRGLEDGLRALGVHIA